MNKNVIIFSLLLIAGLAGCQWYENKEDTTFYNEQGMNISQGMTTAQLMNMNGAPNMIQTLNDNTVIWIYYTSYQPLGQGEVITYGNMPPPPTPNGDFRTCGVRVKIIKNIVDTIDSDCNS